MIALVDADNFYVSVERIFNASLHQKPVVVLSSNDGNVIARSTESKKLGVKMGMPASQLRALVKEHGIIQISSNFSLYGDMSNRMMKVLALFSPAVECYSIDEAFLDLSHVPTERLQEYGEQIRAKVLQYTGIRVSIGIAPTKVLAKIATEIVKKQPEQHGVLSLTTMKRDDVDDLLDKVSVEDVWGIGRKSSAKLQMQGKIFTAKQLREVDLIWIRRVLKVVGVRIVLELRGISCIPLETHSKPKQGIMSSQSFGRPVESLQELEEAIATYASIAAMKLRSQRSQALQVNVFLHTNFFNHRQPQYANSASHTLTFPTAFTPDLIAAAQTCIRHIYKTGYQFKKAGVYLTHITPQDVLQADLFGVFSFDEHERKQRLMEILDEINRFWGRNTIFYGSMGIKREWQMKQKRKSPHYTTRWSELLTIHSSHLETIDEKSTNGKP